MRSMFLTFITAILFISCNSSLEMKEVDYTGYIEQKFFLKGYDKNYELSDSLASVSLKTPVRLDTFYKWEHYSCNTASGWMKYRFADKRYSQFAESGFYWTVVPDSDYQLSIWNKPIREAPDSVILKPLSEKDTSHLYYHPHLVDSPDTVNFLLKKFTLIDQRPFVISVFITSYGYLTHSQTLYVIAETNLESRELYFIGECGAKDTTGFIDNMYKSFLSIRIKENP